MKFYIGFDRRESEVFDVAVHSLKRHCPGVEVMPLVQDNLRAWKLYWREKDERAATDFSLTRFLVPALTFYGELDEWAVFCDCDMLFTGDVARILDEEKDSQWAVKVVKHDYTPVRYKMAGKTNHEYPRKNWSSFILFNCSHPSNRALTPNVVNSADPSWLHQFKWLRDEEIGSLNPMCNFLVGEYAAPDANSSTITEPSGVTPTVLHFTLGIGPYEPSFPDYVAMWNHAAKLQLEDRFQELRVHGRLVGLH